MGSIELSIDRVACVGYYDDSTDLLAYLGRQITKMDKEKKRDDDILEEHQRIVDVVTEGIKYDYWRDKNQNDVWKFYDGTYLSMNKETEGNKFRIDFNPNKCDKSIIKRIMSGLKHIKLTRIDYAVDYKGYNVGPDTVHWEQQGRRRKEKIFKGTDGKMESLYIGTRNSDTMIRIYDKRKEQGEMLTRLKQSIANSKNDIENKEELLNKIEEKFISDNDWWRVEVERSGFTDNWINEVLTDNFNIVKPKFKTFDKAWFNDVAEVSNLSDVDKLALMQLIEHPEMLSMLTNKKTKKKYKQLADCLYREFEPSPHQVFQTNKDRMIKELLELLYPALSNTNKRVGHFAVGLSLNNDM